MFLIFQNIALVENNIFYNYYFSVKFKINHTYIYYILSNHIILYNVTLI